MTVAVDPVVQAFPPQFAAFARGLGGGGDAVPLLQLLRPERLDELARRYGESLGGTHRRAVLSRWSQYYLLLLLPPVVAAALVGARMPELPLRHTGVVLSEDGAPLCIRVPGTARTGGTPGERLEPLLREHLAPLAAGLAASGLPPAVFWSNAGHVMNWALGMLRAPAERVAVLSAALCADEAGPLAPAMRAARQGRRGVCCLRFRLPGLQRCSNCPVGCRAIGP